ncbi:hypothetical protein GCM10023340_35430 [Nocardioides marinquilinus]|uniref:DUF2510 domain-containing protein n=1 Tax=Nocardioides marinquilinus TaxID=1210400 RepID=A0ABP9PWU5_9ACTN
MATLEPGWYPDPEAHGFLRYWDGVTWTLSRVPAQEAGSAAPYPPFPGPDKAGYSDVRTSPVPVGPGQQTPSPWYLRKPFVAAAVVVGLLSIGAAIGNGSDEQDTKEPGKTEQAAATEQRQGSPNTLKATTSESDGVAPVDVEAAEPAKSAKPGGPVGRGQVGGQSNAGGDSFALPDETGKNLQAAQDDVQAVSGIPFFVTFSEDASGEGRAQILDSGWQVCSQQPAAGTMVSVEDDITFFVVRVSESCP